jgi:hypothetical protein
LIITHGEGRRKGYRLEGRESKEGRGGREGIVSKKVGEVGKVLRQAQDK